MGVPDTYVRARIETATKLQATKALAAMGLSVSDAIRLLMIRVADENRLPFDIRVPNEKTIAAMEEIKNGQCKEFNTVAELMADLHAED